MPKNNLFHFIKTQPLKQSLLPFEQAKLVQASDRNQNAYFRFELQINGPTTYFDYELLEHHVSVYEQSQDNSQYHYTAHFKDRQKNQFQLHVFFDQRDKPIQCSFTQKESSKQPIIIRDLDNEWQYLARMTSSNLIKPVRLQYNQLVQDLETRFVALEAEADHLSLNIASHYPAYNQKLEQTCDVLQELDLLARDKRYQGMIKMIKYCQLTFKPTEPVDSSLPTAAEPCSSFSRSETAEAICEKTSIPQPALVDASLDKEIDSLRQQYLDVSKEMTVGYAQRINSLYDQSLQLFLQLECIGDSPTTPNIATFYQLHHQIYREGLGLLRGALSQNLFPIAAQLGFLHHRLDDACLAKALIDKNHVFLDFLLTHGHYLLNNQPICLESTMYESAVQYCFQQGEPLLECFTVLIKHQTSLTTAVINGLPLAYLILSDLNHPFRPAIISQELITNKSFYSQLITGLTCCLVQTVDQSALRKQIKKDINLYRHTLSTFPTEKLPQSHREMNKALTMEIAKGTCGSIHDRLIQDPSVVKLTSEVHYIMKGFAKHLSFADRISYRQNNQTALKLTIDKLAMLQSVPYEQIVQGYTLVLHSQKQYMLNYLRSKEIEHLLKTSKSGATSTSKALRRELLQLRGEIAEHQQKSHSAFERISKTHIESSGQDDSSSKAMLLSNMSSLFKKPSSAAASSASAAAASASSPDNDADHELIETAISRWRNGNIDDAISYLTAQLS